MNNLMKNLLNVLLVLALLASCSKDEPGESPAPVNYDNLVVVTTVDQIDKEDARMLLTASMTLPVGVKRTFLYRPYGNEEFLENIGSLLIDLEQGKKYEVKTRVTIDGNDYDSDIVVFTTLGYHHGPEVHASVQEFNTKFRARFLQWGADDVTDFAQPFVAYVKVGQDSLPVEISNIGESEFTFEISEDTQQFFENDNEYIPNKEFTLGFFSNEYYQNLSTNGQKIYDGVQTSTWTFFNKKPRIDSYLNHEHESCLEADGRKGLLDVKGRFWGLVTGPFTAPVLGSATNNIPDILNVRLTNNMDPSIEKVYFEVDLESLNTVYTQCDSEGMALWRLGIPDSDPGFHSDNLIRLRFNKNYITAGEYTLTVAVEKDNVAFISDQFTVVLE